MLVNIPFNELKAGMLCFFNYVGFCRGLVEIIKIELSGFMCAKNLVEFQILNGSESHGDVSTTNLVDQFYEI